MKEIYRLDHLLDRLRSEHTLEYVYRGQIRAWPHPLLPSIYRGMVKGSPFTNYTQDMRLRERGQLFYEMSTSPVSQFDEEKQRRIAALEYLKQTFGFPLSQLLAQQFGFNSEGLDVTANPDIAAYFATHRGTDSQDSGIRDDPGVIYRFSVRRVEWTVDAISSLTFYECPAFLSASGILGALGTCESWKEAIESFFVFDIENNIRLSCRGPYTRPLHFLKLPRGAFHECRIIRQEAGLLFPDMLLSTFYRTLRIAPPPHKARKDGMPAIEDLRNNQNTEVFLFRHSPDNRQALRITSDTLFPPNDPFWLLLHSFLQRHWLPNVLYYTELGILTNRREQDFVS